MAFKNQQDMCSYCYCSCFNSWSLDIFFRSLMLISLSRLSLL